MGFGEVMVKGILKNACSGYEDAGDEMGILLPAIMVKGFNVKLNPLLILIRENLILTMHYAEVKRLSRVRQYAETLLKKFPLEMPQRDRITLFLSRLIDENNACNFEYLREIEENGDVLSQELADSKASRDQLGQKIYKMKHALIDYLGGLWATVDALNSIRYGDALLISDNPKILNRITSELGEINTQIGLSEHLSDVLASGLEVLQSIYNNQLQILNNKLALVVAYLTIIGTALLVPNTIATVASNSAFVFTPADQGWYLSLIVVSTIVATLVAWWIVKRLGLLPKSPETPDINDSKKT